VAAVRAAILAGDRCSWLDSGGVSGGGGGGVEGGLNVDMYAATEESVPYAMWQQLVHLCWKPQKRHRPTSDDVVNALRQVFRRSAKYEQGVPKLHVHDARDI
jgi:hypothetical protein